MPSRRLPVRPHLDQLRRQARELLKGLKAGDPEALVEFEARHPAKPPAHTASLADAQLVLARSYGATSWNRLQQSVRLSDAIWRDDLDAVRTLIESNPNLLADEVLLRADSNWGPPLTYAANLGRDRIIRYLYSRGATDLESAAGRAALQGHVATARLVYEMAGSPPVTDEALGGPAYTLNEAGTLLMLELGARPLSGRACPVQVVIQTDGRNPAAKHAILAAYERHGLQFPDTPVMALHRGRMDLLERHLNRDPTLLERTFSHREIYPEEMGCGDALDATVGTPVGGSTLLHLCVEYGELEIARWLLERGMSPNVRSRVGADGFGGHTPLFNTVVSQPNFWMNYRNRGPFEAPFTELLLRYGAEVNVRASLWKRLHPGHGDPTRHDYRDVTALGWGRQFHAPIFVSAAAMKLIEAAGGTE